ncbi:MAG: insulinase family protein [Acidobacteria bacterium]|nr:insulinase family protein [Acidobacteriota bacterium]
MSGRADASVAVDVPRLDGAVSQTRLDNGLEVCFLTNRQAPIITCALWYGVGTRDEDPEQRGLAHFLEHMMFKGSSKYGPGEIDRRTQALGGSNNAFTSHDATAYYFNFARRRWVEALRIEADRMAGLTLEEQEVERERRVIMEEISMYEDEPWDALEMAVQQKLFGGHPYGAPVLGTRDSLVHCGRKELSAFHRHFYRPGNSVLVVAGDLPGKARDRVEKHFGALPSKRFERPALEPPPARPGWRRLTRRAGEIPRLQLSVILPAADHPDHAVLRLLVTLLTSGRASRLQHLLVEDLQLCLWISGVVTESPIASQLNISLELVPGAEPEEVEARLMKELKLLADVPPSHEEVIRAKRVLRADWVFSQERVHQQALTAGFSLLLFDLDHPYRHLERALEATPEDLRRVAATYLRPSLGGVVGWSLPRNEEKGG